MHISILRIAIPRSLSLADGLSVERRATARPAAGSAAARAITRLLHMLADTSGA